MHHQHCLLIKTMKYLKKVNQTKLIKNIPTEKNYKKCSFTGGIGQSNKKKKKTTKINETNK